MGGSAGSFLIYAVLITLLHSANSYADDDEHEHHRHTPRIRENPAYADQCGACHIPYRPDFLPSGSWRNIVSHLQNHNGAEIEIEPETLEGIMQYLEANAADRSATKVARKVMKSLQGQMPNRVTDVPYIRRKHHEIPAEVFERESVRSFSNCKACHLTSGRGIYDDDRVRIPE